MKHETMFLAWSGGTKKYSEEFAEFLRSPDEQPGVYILRVDGEAYVGMSSNVKNRVLTSLSQRGAQSALNVDVTVISTKSAVHAASLEMAMIGFLHPKLNGKVPEGELHNDEISEVMSVFAESVNVYKRALVPVSGTEYRNRKRINEAIEHNSELRQMAQCVKHCGFELFELFEMQHEAVVSFVSMHNASDRNEFSELSRQFRQITGLSVNQSKALSCLAVYKDNLPSLFRIFTNGECNDPAGMVEFLSSQIQPVEALLPFEQTD